MRISLQQRRQDNSLRSQVHERIRKFKKSNFVKPPEMKKFRLGVNYAQASVKYDLGVHVLPWDVNVCVAFTNIFVVIFNKYVCYLHGYVQMKHTFAL